MSDYIDFDAEGGGLTVPGISKAREVNNGEYKDAISVFECTKAVRDEVKVEGLIAKGDRNGDVKYLIAISSTKTNNTNINIYHKVSTANAMMSRERFLWDYGSLGEGERDHPGQGDWHMRVLRGGVSAYVRAGGANKAFVFDEEGCGKAF